MFRLILFSMLSCIAFRVSGATFENNADPTEIDVVNYIDRVPILWAEDPIGVEFNLSSWGLFPLEVSENASNEIRQRYELAQFDLISEIFFLEGIGRNTVFRAFIDEESGGISSIYTSPAKHDPKSIFETIGRVTIPSLSYIKCRTGNIDSVIFESLDTLDLFGCNVELDGLNFLLDRCSGLRVIQFPYSGLNFDTGKVRIPKGVERLIVYNSSLGSNFWESLGKADSIREVTLYRCRLPPDCKNKFGKHLNSKFFNSVSFKETITTLELIHSSADLEDSFFNSERWPGVRKLKIISYRSPWIFHPTTRKDYGEFDKDLKDQFPNLNFLEISFSSSATGEDLMKTIVKDWDSEFSDTVDPSSTVRILLTE